MPLISIDFDGVIHSYENYSSRIEGIPIIGAFNFIRELIDNGLDICIFCARSDIPEAITAMRTWLSQRGLEGVYLDRITFPNKKPSKAVLFIDDRGYQFTGSNWPSVEFCRDFKPWNKQ